MYRRRLEAQFIQQFLASQLNARPVQDPGGHKGAELTGLPDPCSQEGRAQVDRAK